MGITGSGNVSIGTDDTKGYRLAVNGAAVFTKVVVKQSPGWPDDVFEPGYNLPFLWTVEQYIRQNKYLEGLPAAIEVPQKGVDIGGMQAALLQKVEEEFTLYVIELKKETAQLKKHP